MDIVFYKTSSGREPVKEYILRLPQDDLELIDKDFRLIKAFGIFKAPVQTRFLRDKLWEIKTGQGTRQRLFYCLVSGPAVMLLHACKKQKDRQARDVEMAYRRMKEVL
jgi:phage-related protein